MLRTHKIAEILSYILTNPEFFNVTFTYVDNEPETPVTHTTTLEGTDVFMMLTERYSEWSFVESINAPDLDVYFRDIIWGEYIKSHQDGFNRLYRALVVSTYNPIENYDSHLQSNTTVGAHKDTDELKFDKYSITTDNANVQVPDEHPSVNHSTHEVTWTNNGQHRDIENYTTAFDENTSFDKPVNKTSEKGGYGNDSSSNTTYDGKQTHTLDFAKRDNTITETRHGNIGVTTNQQMIDAEIELRMKNNLFDMVIDEFAKQHLILVGDEHDSYFI